MIRAFRPDRHARILGLLDSEREVILAGPLAALAPLVEKREAALSDLLESDAAPPEAFLIAMRAKSERNARLIAASIDGIRTAAAQIEALRAASESLRTYTAQGAPRVVSSRPSSRDERA